MINDIDKMRSRIWIIKGSKICNLNYHKEFYNIKNDEYYIVVLNRENKYNYSSYLREIQRLPNYYYHITPQNHQIQIKEVNMV